jgi:hypothetical protein
MPAADSFGPHETGGQPYDRPGAEGIKKSRRIACGLARCFLDSVGNDDQYAFAVGMRALIDSESIGFSEDVGPRWRSVLEALAAEAAVARWWWAGSRDEAVADFDRVINEGSQGTP